MQKVIYKYPLKMRDYDAVLMPKGAEILTAQAQYEVPCIWALVDPDAEKEQRVFRIAGTGRPVTVNHTFTGKLEYINTFQLNGGSLILHVFEVKE